MKGPIMVLWYMVKSNKLGQSVCKTLHRFSGARPHTARRRRRKKHIDVLHWKPSRSTAAIAILPRQCIGNTERPRFLVPQIGLRGWEIEGGGESV